MKLVTMDYTDYDVTESECPRCEDGALWVNSFELVCEECDTVFRKTNVDDEGVSRDTPLQDFYENRCDHTYDNSGLVRMPGGFSEAYEGEGIYGDQSPQ